MPLIPSSSSIVFRGRLENVVIPPATTLRVAVSGDWIQAADEVDQLFGQIVATGDNDTLPDDELQAVWYNSDETVIYLDGTVNGGGATETSLLTGNIPYIFEPGTPTARAITIVFDNESQTGSFTVKSLAIDVLGSR